MEGKTASGGPTCVEAGPDGVTFPKVLNTCDFGVNDGRFLFVNVFRKDID